MAKGDTLLLSILSPCLEEGKEVVAHLDWTVLRVKQEIEKLWEDHPKPNDQRLIHAGKLLDNSALLKNVLRLDEDLTHYTVYLVSRPLTTPPLRTPSQGLKKRIVQQPTVAIERLSQSESANVDHWQAYFQQFVGLESGSEEQNIMVQQMYAQYLNQYMQYWNYHSMTPFPANALRQQTMALQPHNQLVPGGGLNPVAAAAAAAAVVGQHQVATDMVNQGQAPDVPQAPQPPPAPQVENNNLDVGGGNAMMNAGAGAVGAMEEDEDDIGGGERDILDWIYVTTRVIVLLSVVYYYSSLARLALVVGLFLAIYFHRMGLFGGQRIDQPGNQRDQANRDQQVNDDNNNNPGDADEDSSSAVDNNHVAEVAEPQQAWHSLALTFVTTFFTSLMPNDPQVI